MKKINEIIKAILIRFQYIVDDNCIIKNIKFNILDYFLAFLYMAISLYNAMAGMDNLQLLNSEQEIDIVSIKTLLFIVVNWIVLFRLHIKLQISFLDLKTNIELIKNNEKYNLITIEAITLRIRLIRDCYIAFLVVLLYIYFFQNVVIRSAAILAVIASLVTFFNNFLDISINMYSARPKIGYIRYF